MSEDETGSILDALVASLDPRPAVARIEVGTIALPVRHAVHWRALGGVEHLGTSRTLSILGLTFESSRELRTGESLEMDVDLPDGKHLTGLATVETVEPHEPDVWLVTVRFGDAELTSDDEEPLRRLWASLAAQG